jgi:DNA polymerase-3 subunit delta
MKLAYPQLEQHLQKALSPIYLVSGDEILLVEEAIATIRQHAEKHGYNERKRIELENLLTEANEISLFSDKKIVEINLRNNKLLKAATEILQTYAARPAASTICLLNMSKLDGRTEQAAWFKAIDKAGVTLTIWPIAKEQLPNWIMQRAQKLKLNLARPAALLLAEQVEGNLLAASQELEKLRLMQITETITEDTLMQCATDNARFDVFNLVDSLLSGNSTRTLRILNNLLAEDIEPTLILWALSRELRTMTQICDEAKKGTPLPSLFTKYRIWDKRQPNVRTFLKNFSPAKGWSLLSHAALIDRIIKGGEKGNIRVELEKLVLSCKSTL